MEKLRCTTETGSFDRALGLCEHGVQLGRYEFSGNAMYRFYRRRILRRERRENGTPMQTIGMKRAQIRLYAGVAA